MEIIPVLDLSQGSAVHARGGRRGDYQPVRSLVAHAAPGDAVALARGFREALEAPRLYVADLDALQGGSPQRGLTRQVIDAFGRPALVDAGLRHPANAIELSASGVDTVVIGLESLHGFEPVSRALVALGPARVALSLDLRNGRALLSPALEALHGVDVAKLAEAAMRIGVERFLLVDVGRVGRETGVDLALVQKLRTRLPDAELLVGGGIRSVEELAQLADAGVQGALVATALHAGRITKADCLALAARQSKSSSVR